MSGEPTNVIQRIIRRLDVLEAKVAKLEQDMIQPVEQIPKASVKQSEDL
jgi:hypothetical protein